MRDPLPTCPVCGHSLKPHHHFCYHCVIAFIDSNQMSPTERNAYSTALFNWYGLHASLSLEDKPVADTRRCSLCKAGEFDPDKVCGNCGHIALPIKQLYHTTTLPVLERAVRIRRKWLLTFGPRIENYGVEDFTNAEEVKHGHEEKYRRFMDDLNAFERHVKRQFEEARKQQEKLVDEVSEEILEAIRRSPKAGYESLTEGQRDKINAWIRNELAPAQIKTIREALQYAQKKVERTMYYGQEMILPDSPFWDTLNADQHKAMLARHKLIKRWWHWPSLISYLIYCLTAPFLSAGIGLIAWLGSLVVLTAIAVSWYSQLMNSMLSKASMVMIVAGLVILVIATWYLRLPWLTIFGGLALIGLGSTVIPALLRGLYWYVRNALIK